MIVDGIAGREEAEIVGQESFVAWNGGRVGAAPEPVLVAGTEGAPFAF